MKGGHRLGSRWIAHGDDPEGSWLNHQGLLSLGVGPHLANSGGFEMTEFAPEKPPEKPFAVLMTKEGFELFKKQDPNLFSQSEYINLKQKLQEILSYAAQENEASMTTDDEEMLRILPFAEQELQEAASAFREAGEIAKQSAARLNTRSKEI
ncbi:MAG: hypothetical protein JOZ05_25860, partial [Acetobacteraceae bacterium]|nr:hypothetical protein [Acetobacteraceae bacterium]